MTLGHHIRMIACVAIGFAVASTAHAKSTCANPGSILDVPTPSFLRNKTPKLVVDFERGGSLIPVMSVVKTTSRLRITMPSTGLVSDAQFKIRHVEPGGSTKVIATARICVFRSPTGGTGGTTGSAAATATQSARARLVPATRFDVVAPSGAPEFVLVGEPGAVSRAEGIVSQAGGVILRRRGLNALGLGMASVDLGGFISLDALRSELARRRIDVAAGRHNVYGLAAGELNYARQLLTGQDSVGCSLRRTIRVGLIDGPVNVRHPALAGMRIETASVLSHGDASASADHATGLAGLIASQDMGLAPGVTLFSVTAVSRAGTREIAKLEDFAAALNWMVARQMDVVNMSLAGPSNAALARAIEVAADRGLILVAAVGNDRRAEVAYPASDSRVIAVTAVDADKRLYRRASTGEGVDFSAPGVDLRVPTARRIAFRSGTSYASAALTALIAVELANGQSRSASDVRRALANSAEDLGVAGRDTHFGLGLALANNC